MRFHLSLNAEGHTGLDYANQRYYASTYGRFNTPDPYAGSAHPRNPLSWNRYSYVRGDPVNHSDRRGLDCDSMLSADPSCDNDSNAIGGSDSSCDLTCITDQAAASGYLGTSLSSMSYASVTDADLCPAGPGCNSEPVGSDDPPPCAPAQTGFGAGVVAGASGEAGVEAAGSTVQASTGAGVFINGNGQPSAGLFASGAATAYVGGSVAGRPTQTGRPGVGGAFAGYGPGLFITNAGSPQQLAGPFWTLTANIGVGIGQASVSFGSSGDTWLATASAGPFPFAGGLGLSVSTATTNTAATSTSPCP